MDHQTGNSTIRLSSGIVMDALIGRRVCLSFPFAIVYCVVASLVMNDPGFFPGDCWIDLLLRAIT